MGPVVRRPISAGVELLSGFLFLSFKSILELAGNFKLKLNLLFPPFKSLKNSHKPWVILTQLRTTRPFSLCPLNKIIC